jgi:hypothetical protein
VSSEIRWIWRIIGCLGVPSCAWSAVESIDAYQRHRASGDQAGFAMGMTFLNFWFVPATVIALLLSAVPVRPPEVVSGLGPRLVRLAIASVLSAGAVFFLGFQAFVRRMEAQDMPPGHVATSGAWLYYGVVEPAILIAFAGLLAGCAVAVLWPSAARSPWFTAMLVGVGIVGGAAIAALLAESMQSVFLTLPTVALVLVVTWTLRAIHRGPGKESAAG